VRYTYYGAIEILKNLKSLTLRARRFTKENPLFPANLRQSEDTACARFARGADECVRPYTRLFPGEIFFFENAAVVEFVAGGDVGQGTDADLVVVGDAATHPRLLVEIAK
jgi:hypothetical protein